MLAYALNPSVRGLKQEDCKMEGSERFKSSCATQRGSLAFCVYRAVPSKPITPFWGPWGRVCGSAYCRPNGTTQKVSLCKGIPGFSELAGSAPLQTQWLWKLPSIHTLADLCPLRSVPRLVAQDIPAGAELAWADPMINSYELMWQLCAGHIGAKWAPKMGTLQSHQNSPATELLQWSLG